MYEVYRSTSINKKLEKSPPEIQLWVGAVEHQLAENPYTGNPLKAKWFREKKLKKFRVYYLIYDDLNSVYIVDLSDKKEQQFVINVIKLFRKKLREELEQLRKERKRAIKGLFLLVLLKHLATLVKDWLCLSDLNREVP